MSETSPPPSFIPTKLKAGEVMRAELDGKPVTVVGAAPYNAPVILSPDGWQTLRAWQFTSLRLIRGHIHACAGRYRVMAARLLTGTVSDASTVIVYRSGNPLDLRPSNVLAAPAAAYRRVRGGVAVPENATTRSTGHALPYNFVSARTRIRRLLEA